jgi:RNA polymerase sigma factor (sigma-70 family)
LTSYHQLQNLSDVELAAQCIQHQRTAWEEFFRRFSPLIKTTIRRTFIKCKVRDLAEDIDNILDIHALLVEKLYAKGALKQCTDLSGLRSWIVRITANQSIDWLKQRGRIKHLPLRVEEQLMQSLSAPLGEDQGFSLQDLVEDEDADLFFQLEQVASQLYAECVIEQIGKIENVKNRWILRLHIIGQLALSNTELEQLQSFSPFQGDELNDRISVLEDSLAEKEQVRQDDLGKTVLSWHQLRGIEIKIARLDMDTFSDHSQEIDELKKEWTEIGNRKMELLSNCHTLPSPSNMEIAEIIGIPEKNCGDVSQYLKRAQTALRKKMDLLSEN